MAFNKRTWKGRQGTGLNKFSIDGATPVTVINQPDSVTEQGDALSAGNLNDLEDRIYDAFDDIADGTQIVGKATADASGNVITSTYATKSELTSEATARANADSNLKDAIQFNRRRIENLEQKSGSVVDVDYPDYSVYGEVPTGKAKNAIVSKMRGVTVAYNQQLQGVVPTFTLNGVTFTNNEDGSMTLTGTASPQISEELFTQYVSYKANHKYSITGLQTKTGISFGIKGFVVNNPSDFLFTHTSDWSHGIAIKITDGTNTNGVTLSPVISDLTQMFGSSVADYLYSIEQATTGAGVALFRALVSAQDNSHETGRLVSTTYSALVSRGKNLIDETSLVRKDRDGVSSNNWIIFNTPIKYESGQTYYFKCNNFNLNVYNINLAYFDSNGELINIIAERYLNPSNGFTITASNVPNASYMTLGFYHSSSLASYSPTEVICCLNSVSDKTYTPYWSPVTLHLPESVTLRGILKVVNNALTVNGDEYELETGDVTRKFVQTVLGTGWAYYNGVFRKTFSDRASEGFRCPKYPNGSSVTRDDDTIWFEYLVNPKDIVIRDDSYNGDVSAFEADNKNVPLLYAIANPTQDTPLAPVLDPILATEGGGTLSTEQTQDPSIVSALEMTYLTL